MYGRLCIPAMAARPGMAINRALHPLASYLWLVALLAPIASGILAPLCFPPYKIWPLVCLVLIPFGCALRVREQAVWVYSGAVIGSIMFLGIGLQFIERISNYENQSLGEHLFRFWLLATLLGVWVWPLAAWLTRFLYSKCQVPFSMAFVTGWITAEHSRHWFCQVLTNTECPWMHFGYSLSGQHELLQLASLGGTTLISAVIVAVNAALTDVCFARGRAWRSATIRLMCIAGMLSCEFAYEKWHLCRATLTHGPRIAIVAESPGSRDASEIIQEIEAQAVDNVRDNDTIALFVWPELAMPEVTFSNRSTQAADSMSQLRLQNIEDLSARLQSDLFIGFPRKSSNSRQGTRWNSVLHVAPKTGVVAFSDKQFLVPFAEQTPTWGQTPVMQSVLRTPNRGRNEFAMKQGVRVFEVAATTSHGKLRIAPCICYDCSSPTYLRDAACRTDIILHLGSEPRDPERTVAQWLLDMAILRAVETGRPVVRCSRDGYSGVIDSFGRPVVLEQNPWAPAPILYASVPLSRRDTLYCRLGDWPLIASWMLCLVLLLIRGCNTARQQ